MIKDSEGTEFDPFEHNLLDGEPPVPVYSKTSKFVKVRGANGNGDEVVTKWLDHKIEKEKFNTRKKVSDSYLKKRGMK